MEAEPPTTLAECRLDVPALREQRDRYRRLGAHVEHVERAPGRVAVEFDSAVDIALVQYTLAVERECCPFFVLEWDGDARRLTVGVERADQAPALEAIASAFGLA